MHQIAIFASEYQWLFMLLSVPVMVCAAWVFFSLKLPVTDSSQEDVGASTVVDIVTHYGWFTAIASVGGVLLALLLFLFPAIVKLLDQVGR